MYCAMYSHMYRNSSDNEEDSILNKIDVGIWNNKYKGIRSVNNWINHWEQGGDVTL